MYASLSPNQQELVRVGRISKGMPKGGVFLAWGKPDHVSSGLRSGREFEAWRYRGYEPIYAHRVGFWGGPGWGRSCYGYPGYNYGTDVYYHPYIAARVDFINNRVTGWESAR